MDRKAFVNAAAWELRQPATRRLGLSRFVPDFAGAAANQAGIPQRASRLGYPPVQQAQPLAPFPTTDPGDLVARALQILAEENDAWQARQGLNLTPRSIR
jgi:hypothetical protein